MAKVIITIDADGNPTPQYAHVKPGQQVQWIADDPTQVWYILFDSPFLEDVIVTDPDNNGKTKPENVRKAYGVYSYQVSASNDPLLSRRGTKSALRPFTSGGGIIVDA
jgi:hypothetical protein